MEMDYFMEKQQMTSSLKDINVVVTGAGRGLGAALALTLSDMGCNVILCGRLLEALDSIADHIEARTGRDPKRVVMDLADAASVEAAAKEITLSFPVIDVLINNGAMWLEYRQVPYSAAEVIGVIGSAVTGTFLLTQALLQALQDSQRPDVVTIGSVSGLPNTALYNAAVPFYAAKHAQVGLADGLRQLFLGTPVRSICIHPPWLEDISPLDPAWEAAPGRSKGLRATNRDVVEAVIFAITRPRHITIASMIIDSDSHGMDFRSHLEA
jgi:NADP-dependent 3-hydroxy acid dehydrogenase YdfG